MGSCSSAPAGGVRLTPLGELLRDRLGPAYLAGQLDVTTWSGSVVLGLVLWLGFPALILTGSVLWDSVSWQLAAVHTGDWLAKLVVIATVVGVWH